MPLRWWKFRRTGCVSCRVLRPLPGSLPDPAACQTRQLTQPVRRIRTGEVVPPEEISMRIAITGATGFLGRYLVRHLAGQGYQLRCWYRPGSDRTGFENIAGAVEWLPGTLGDE